MKRMNTQFAQIIQDAKTIRDLYAVVLQNKGKSVTQLRVIVDDMNDIELTDMLELGLKQGVTDEYEFVSFLRAYCDPSARLESAAADAAAQASDKHRANREPVVLLGHNASATAARIVTHLYVAALSGDAVVYLLQGDSATGKTCLLRAIADMTTTRQLRTETMSMLEQKPTVCSIANPPQVYLLDDVDKYIEYPQFESIITQLLLLKKTSLVMTATSIKKIEKLAAMHKAIITTIGDYTANERSAILAQISTKGYHLTPACADQVFSALTVFGSKSLMQDAMITRQYLLFQVLHHVKDKPSGGGALDFGTHDLLTAVAQTLGKDIDTLSFQPDELIFAKLRTRIKGQTNVLRAVIPTIQLFLSGAYDPVRPASVLLFYGPSGTGKTELAHAIADHFADGVFHLENMSEYMEKHTAARFVGSPPGYLGFNETPAILQYLDQHTRGVLLLDEIEKAHPDIMTFLMQLFDTGCITDGAGKRHYARGWIIILTSNLAIAEPARSLIGFGQEAGQSESVSPRQEIASLRFFKPEVLNRITSVHKFSPFTREELEDVARSLLQTACAPLKARSIAVDIEPYVTDVVAAFDPVMGARAMRTYVDMTVIPSLLKASMERSYHAYD